MVGGTVKTQVDTQGDRRPRRVLLAAVKTYLVAMARQSTSRPSGPRGRVPLVNAPHLVCRLILQLLKDLVRLLLRRQGTHLERGYRMRVGGSSGITCDLGFG